MRPQQPSNEVVLTVGATPRTTFGAGRYLVGQDIAAGRYYTVPNYGCYWERLSGLGGTSGEILANELVGTVLQAIVDVRSSDLAFSTDADGRTWTNAPRYGFQSTIQPGAWLVGTQAMSADRAPERTAPQGRAPKMERLIGIDLRAGVTASSVCLAVGLVLSLATSGGVLPGFLLNAGIIILLATPVARVIVSTVQYVSERDWGFATLTFVVLLELVASAVAALVLNRRV